MRSQRSLLFCAMLLCTLVMSVTSMAAEPHSWCVTGEGMVQNGSTDDTTNRVVSYVCTKPGFDACCTTRWSLACVQAGADYARNNNLSGGDYCGRYAWTQGLITKTNADGSKHDFKQYYPRDFNLMALSGNVASLRDVNGAVAARGNASIN
jgi:hypothetical protein